MVTYLRRHIHLSIKNKLRILAGFPIVIVIDAKHIEQFLLLVTDKYDNETYYQESDT